MANWTWPWSYEEKLLVWRLMWHRVEDEQWKQNEREADRVIEMSDAEIYAQALAEYGSAAAVERCAEMTRQIIHRAIQRHHPTRH